MFIFCTHNLWDIVANKPIKFQHFQYLELIKTLLSTKVWLSKYRGSSHNAVLPQRGFPSYTDVLVLVRGGVRTFYLINSSNTVFLSRLKNQCYRRTPCTVNFFCMCIRFTIVALCVTKCSSASRKRPRVHLNKIMQISRDEWVAWQIFNRSTEGPSPSLKYQNWRPIAKFWGP